MAMLDSTVGERIGATHAALVKMEREQNEMAARVSSNLSTSKPDGVCKVKCIDVLFPLGVGRGGGVHAPARFNCVHLQLKKLEAMDRKQAKTGGSKDAVSAVVTSLTVQCCPPPPRPPPPRLGPTVRPLPTHLSI